MICGSESARPAPAPGPSSRPASLAEVQDLLLQALLEVDRVCRALDIDYALVGGSALGLLRHEGFIPWDDDVDLAMSPQDVARFAAEAPALLSSRYTVQTRDDDPLLGAECKIYLEGTRMVDDFGSVHGLLEPDHTGLFVDVFGLWPLAAGERRRSLERALAWLVYVRPWALRMSRSGQAGSGAALLARRLRFLVAGLVPRPLVRRLGRSLERLAHRRVGARVGLGLGGVHGGPFGPTDLLPSREATFAGQPVRGPGALVDVVRAAFGDSYRHLPPESERRRHARQVLIEAPHGPGSTVRGPGCDE